MCKVEIGRSSPARALLQDGAAVRATLWGRDFGAGEESLSGQSVVEVLRHTVPRL